MLQARCGWSLTDFQIKSLEGLAAGKDVVLHAGTGSGKTAVIAALHMLAKTEGMISFVVSPLIALQDEQVSHLNCISYQL